MKLTETQYLKWKISIQQMWLEESKLKETTLKSSLMEKEIEVLRLKHNLYRETIRAQQDKVKDSKVHYNDLKQEIEKELDISLNDCVIDEVTYEITELKQ